MGLLAAVQLLFLQIYPSVAVAPPKRLLTFTVAGVIAIALFAPLLIGMPWFIGIAMLLPLPVVVHLLYLNRNYLFRLPAYGA